MVFSKWTDIHSAVEEYEALVVFAVLYGIGGGNNEEKDSSI